MTRNPFSDGQALLAGGLNALSNAHASEGIVSGVTPSKGAGSYDVDIASGTALIANDLITVSADTVTLTSAAADADLDAGEFRVDTITVNNTGTVNVAEGTAAVTPIAPDIPTDEALIALVIVDGSASSIAADDIRDRRVIVTQQSSITWVEDGNSPDTFSGVSSVSYTLDGTYDHVLVIVSDFVGSGSLTDPLNLQANGDTGTNYNYVRNDDTRISGSSVIKVGGNNNVQGSTWSFEMSGTWPSGTWGINVSPSGSSQDVAHAGENTSITSPLTEFQIAAGGGNISGQLNVYGVTF